MTLLQFQGVWCRACECVHVIFGCVLCSKSAVRYVEQNKTFKGAVEAVVDKIMLSNNPDDQTIVKILMRETRRPELGDKFSSR